MKNTTATDERIAPLYCLLRLHRKNGSLRQGVRELGLQVQENASVKDVADGDAYSYASLVFVAPQTSYDAFYECLEKRLSDLADKIGALECDAKWIEIFSGIKQNDAYSCVSVPTPILSLIVKSGCMLQITCCQLLENAI